MGMTRRAWMAGAAGIGATAITEKTRFLRGPNPSPVKSVPAKWDITLFDRPGWCSHAWYHIVEPDGTIVVPIQSSDMRAPYGDFIRTETDDLVLKSRDNGHSWTEVRDASLTAFPWGCYGLPAKAPDGKLVSVVSADYVATPDERRAHLEQHGLTEFYTPRTEWLYRPWPLSMAESLRRKGIYLFEGDEGSDRMAFSLLGYCCRTSNDGGKSWTIQPITGLPFFSNEAGSFRNLITTRQGVWVASVFGTPNPNRDPVPADGFGTSKLPIGSYALRSADRGATWTIHTIAYDSSGEHSFDETALLELPSGRILAMLRHSGFADSSSRDVTLYRSHSADGGRTWATPVSSGIVGYPAHLLLLRNNRVLCTVGHRLDPWGHQAVISADEGRTWSVPKVIRDDSLPGWTTYPMSSQLRDGSIFTTYGNLKRLPPAARAAFDAPGTFRSGKQQEFVYAAASVYRPEFTHTLDAV
ncbi:MAG: hypothetical protein DMG69_02820 [Acidobacteria bacterium]|nr:MAG: hypothetical protein DMG69_02820 [Acidobacteriota bacterium]